MCPTAEHLTGEVVGVETQSTSTSTNDRQPNGQADRTRQQRNPYAPRYSDFLSNVCNFKIIESTLRGKPLRFFCRVSAKKCFFATF